MNILHILSANIFDILTVSWEYFYRVWDIVEYSKCESVTIYIYMICYCTPIFDSDFDCYKSSGYTSSPSPAANPWMNRHFSTQTAAAEKIWTGILGTPMQQQFGFPFMSWGPLTPIDPYRGVELCSFCGFLLSNSQCAGKVCLVLWFWYAVDVTNNFVEKPTCGLLFFFLFPKLAQCRCYTSDGVG